jgi:hypothetical protein
MTKRTASANISALLALVLAVPLALGVVIAWAPLRDSFPSPEPEPYVPQKRRAPAQPPANPKDDGNEPPAPMEPKKEPPKKVSQLPAEPELEPHELVRELALGTAEGIEDIYAAPHPREFVEHFLRDALARTRCAKIAGAIDAYIASDRNPGVTPEERFPASERDLFEPPFGGPSFLPLGRRDLIDPWGKPFQFHFVKRPDGTTAVEVFTYTPNDAYISQYGIGLP